MGTTKQRAIAERFLEKVKPSTAGCWEWIGQKTRGGYGALRLPMHGPLTRAHRVAWLLFNGPISDGLCVLHKCDNPGCVNPSHLFVGTLTDNMQDCSRKGRVYRAPLNSKTGKTTLAERETIRELYRDGRSQNAIADQFGVTQRRISQIVNGGKDVRRYRKYHSPEIIAAIRRRYATGVRQTDLASEFGLAQATISRIIRGESGG